MWNCVSELLHLQFLVIERVSGSVMRQQFFSLKLKMCHSWQLYSLYTLSWQHNTKHWKGKLQFSTWFFMVTERTTTWLQLVNINIVTFILLGLIQAVSCCLIQHNIFPCFCFLTFVLVGTGSVFYVCFSSMSANVILIIRVLFVCKSRKV